jgi:hypothetical protein
VPVRHITQLQPFVKKLTGSDGELPFSYERANELGWVVCDDELPFGNMPVDSSVLRTCKTIYTEGKRRQFLRSMSDLSGRGSEAKAGRQRQQGKGNMAMAEAVIVSRTNHRLFRAHAVRRTY